MLGELEFCDGSPIFFPVRSQAGTINLKKRKFEKEKLNEKFQYVIWKSVTCPGGAALPRTAQAGQHSTPRRGALLHKVHLHQAKNLGVPTSVSRRPTRAQVQQIWRFCENSEIYLYRNGAEIAPSKSKQSKSSEKGCAIEIWKFANYPGGAALP